MKQPKQSAKLKPQKYLYLCYMQNCNFDVQKLSSVARLETEFVLYQRCDRSPMPCMTNTAHSARQQEKN